MNTIEQELSEHAEIQNRLLQIGRRLMASKRQLQAEIREDAKKPEFQAAITRLRQARETKNGNKLAAK